MATLRGPVLLFLAVGFFWGSEWLLAAPLADLPHFRLLALRCLVAGLALLPFATRTAVSLAPNALLGVVLIALPAFFLAMRTDLSPGMVVVLFATLPMLASIFEGRGMANPVALLGGLAGVAFLVRGGLSLGIAQAGSAVGLLLVLAAMALVLVRARRWLRQADLAVSVALQMMTAAVLFGGYSVVREGAARASFSWPAAGALLGLGVFAGALGYYLFYRLLLATAAPQAAALQWLLPCVGVAESTLWLRHVPAWDSLLGGLLALISAFLLLRAPLQGDDPLTLQITTVPDCQKASLRSGSR